jgi:hypothetical protein
VWCFHSWYGKHSKTSSVPSMISQLRSLSLYTQVQTSTSIRTQHALSVIGFNTCTERLLSMLRSSSTATLSPRLRTTAPGSILTSNLNGRLSSSRHSALQPVPWPTRHRAWPSPHGHAAPTARPCLGRPTSGPLFDHLVTSPQAAFPLSTWSRPLL